MWTTTTTFELFAEENHHPLFNFPLPAGVFALLWAAFFLTHYNEKIRYLLPLSVFLSLPAGAFGPVSPSMIGSRNTSPT